MTRRMLSAVAMSVLVVGLLPATGAAADDGTGGGGATPSPSTTSPSTTSPASKPTPQRAAQQRTAPRAAAAKTLEYTKKPSVSGTRRYGKTLTAHRGVWKGGTPTLRYQWVRNGKPISGATGTKYKLRVADPGAKVTVRVTASRSGYATRLVKIPSPGKVKHRRDIRKVIYYRVRVDGVPSSRLPKLRRYLVQTYQDARGWRASGVKLVRVSKGGSFTVVLARASRVPGYSSACSAKWSCRVGRNVIINDSRWRQATRAWRGAKRSLAGYRHMVISHETGHWFGKGHVGCSGRGTLAPVMMQQSKGFNGCKPNPWPKTSELGIPRWGWKA